MTYKRSNCESFVASECPFLRERLNNVLINGGHRCLPCADHRIRLRAHGTVTPLETIQVQVKIDRVTRGPPIIITVSYNASICD